MKKYSKKNDVFPVEIRADREEWIELMGLSPSDESLRFVGLSAASWSAIIAGRRPLVSTASHRLASFRRYGHLADLLGASWRDFFVSPDTLVFPGMKNGVSVLELRSVWLSVSEVPRLRREVQELRALAEVVDVSPAVRSWLFRLGEHPIKKAA